MIFGKCKQMCEYLSNEGLEANTDRGEEMSGNVWELKKIFGVNNK